MLVETYVQACLVTSQAKHSMNKNKEERLLRCQKCISLLLTWLRLAAEVTRYQQRLDPASRAALRPLSPVQAVVMMLQ